MLALTGAEVLLRLPRSRRPCLHRASLRPPADHHHGHPHATSQAHGGGGLGVGGAVEGLPVDRQHLVALLDCALLGRQSAGEHLVDLARGGWGLRNSAVDCVYD